MLVAPSILTADFSKLKEELKSINNADYIHIDIMDGHFVPNISFGPYITSIIAETCDKPLDTHLMVTNPVDWIEKFAVKNTKYITVHYESNDYLKAIELIKKANIKSGISIKPKTKVNEIKHLLPMIDLVLIMSVEPGFGGQAFMPNALDKIKQLVQIRKELNLDFIIEVDGGINEQTIDLVKDAGVDMVVAGSYIFNKDNRRKIIKELKAK